MSSRGCREGPVSPASSPGVEGGIGAVTLRSGTSPALPPPESVSGEDASDSPCDNVSPAPAPELGGGIPDAGGEHGSMGAQTARVKVLASFTTSIGTAPPSRCDKGAILTWGQMPAAPAAAWDSGRKAATSRKAAVMASRLLSKSSRAPSSCWVVTSSPTLETAARHQRRNDSPSARPSTTSSRRRWRTGRSRRPRPASPSVCRCW